MDFEEGLEKSKCFTKVLWKVVLNIRGNKKVQNCLKVEKMGISSKMAKFVYHTKLFWMVKSRMDCGSVEKGFFQTGGMGGKMVDAQNVSKWKVMHSVYMKNFIYTLAVCCVL